MSKIKMVLCDMDGTLLRDDKTVSCASLEAIDELRRRGILFVPASGRSFFALPDEVQRLGSLRYAILINGALVWDVKNRRALRRADISPERALAVFELMKRYPVTRDVYMNDCEAWMEREFYDELADWVITPTSYRLISRTRRPKDDLCAFIGDNSLPVQKIQGFFRDEDTRVRVTDELRRAFPDMSISGAVPLNVELTDRTADKGLCAQFLMEYLGLRPDEVIAFGDEDNDCSMLQCAGIGAVMSNGSAHAKSCADVICPSNDDDGFAWGIDHLVLT